MATSISDALAELRRQFASQLSTRIEMIHAHVRRMETAGWQTDEAVELHRLVHGLTGLAGTFGMPSVSDAARMLESRLAIQLKTGVAPAAEEWEAILGALGRLDHITRIRIQSNAPNLPPSPVLPRLDHSTLIYLVEDDPVQAEHLSQALCDDGFRVVVFTELEAFRAACIAPDLERPAAVVMDMVFPEGDVAGADLLVELKAQSAQCPPVVFASVRDDMPARLAALRAGASRYLVKPVDPGRLIELLDALSGRQPPLPYRILMVDDDPLVLAAHSTVLRAAGMEVYALSQPLRILDVLNTFAPDVVVLDVYMPEASGPELAAALRERDALQQLPILFLSSEVDMSQQLLALNLGGDDFLVKPVQPDHLIAAVTGRARRARQSATIRQHLDVMLYEREREHLALNQHAIVSIADQAGDITYVNDKFCEISGYSRDEALGRNHRIIKSGVHPPAFYQNLWDTITDGRVWEGEICNRRKDGSLYWVESSITPFLDADGLPYQYVSIRTDISRMKAVEVALRASETRFRETLDQAPALIWVADTEKRDIWYNRRWLEYTGHTMEQALGTDRADGLHPDDRSHYQQICQNAFSESRPFDLEFRQRRADGSYGWLASSGIPRFSVDGVFEGYIGYCWDIDDRKRAEIALAEHERQLREAQNLARIGNWTADLVSGVLIWSDEIYRIFGQEPGSFAPSVEAFHAVVHPDDRERVLESEARAQQTGRHDVVHRIVRPDGSIRHVHELAQAETNAAGTLVRLSGTVQDITERVEAETRLRESQEKLSGLFELSPLGIALTDMEGRYLQFNEAFRAICGYPAEELKNLDSWALTPRAYEPQESAQLELLNKTGRYGPYEKAYRQKDGTLIPIRLNGILVKGQSGQPQIWSIIEDITDHKQAEQALIAARDEADRASRAKSDFLSSMSHELRTPMNAILGFGQLMEYDDTLPDEHRDNVQEILKAGHHLLELINEVLDLAKVESGHIDLSLEPLDVCPIVDECLSLISPLASKRGIQMSYDGLKGAMVRGDRTRFKQALLNLLSNAVKYNREGGEVRIEARPEGEDRLRILVSDSGSGIPAERLTELFLPFNRLDAEQSDIEGTGIGLTITRRIVEMMGGAVGVESTVGVGSVFWIELPLESAPASVEDRPTGGTAVDRATPGPVVDAAQHVVLYIEDNPANIRLVAQILGRRPHIHLLTAHTPELGIELALARHPELILLDINLPGMNGYQVLDVFKADARLQVIPVVAITANAMPRDIERGKAAGFADYLTKPLDLGHFHRVVDACLGQADAPSTPHSGGDE